MARAARGADYAVFYVESRQLDPGADEVFSTQMCIAFSICMLL